RRRVRPHGTEWLGAPIVASPPEQPAVQCPTGLRNPTKGQRYDRAGEDRSRLHGDHPPACGRGGRLPRHLPFAWAAASPSQRRGATPGAPWFGGGGSCQGGGRGGPVGESPEGPGGHRGKLRAGRPEPCAASGRLAGPTLGPHPRRGRVGE